jgi:protein subunit release factor A
VLEAKLAKLEKSSSSQSSAQTSKSAQPQTSDDSSRIGTKNFDEDSEFGERIAYV